jgi:cobalt/nickel transport system permease protein
MNFYFLAAGLFIAVLSVKLAKIKFREIAGRMLLLNFFLLILFVTVPFTRESDAECLFRIYSLGYSIDGLLFALKILVRSNILTLLITSLLSTINFVILGHALNHLLFPRKLIHLMLFSIRYLSVIHQEFVRMHRAAVMRGFTPRMNLHTYRTFAHFAGTLLVRSLKRSERIIDAMKCRGFNGNFYLVYHFESSGKDWAVGLGMFFLLIILMYGDFYV